MSAALYRRFAGAGEVDIKVCPSGHVHLIITAEGQTLDYPLGRREAVAIADGLIVAADYLDDHPEIPNGVAAAH